MNFVRQMNQAWVPETTSFKMSERWGIWSEESSMTMRNDWWTMPNSAYSSNKKIRDDDQLFDNHDEDTDDAGNSYSILCSPILLLSTSHSFIGNSGLFFNNNSPSSSFFKS